MTNDMLLLNLITTPPTCKRPYHAHGLVGEYVMTTNARVTKRPLVVEEERINF